MQPPEAKSFADLGFVQTSPTEHTRKMVKIFWPTEYGAALANTVCAWIVYPLNSNPSTEAWTSCNGTTWVQRLWVATGWHFPHDNGTTVYYQEGQAQVATYKATFAYVGNFEKAPMAFIALHPSVNPHVMEALAAARSKALQVGNDSVVMLGAAGTPATPAPAAALSLRSVVSTNELCFTSATRLVIEATNQSTAEDIANVFSAAHLYGLTELDLSQVKDACPIAAAVVRLKPPFLRSVTVASPPTADSLSPLCEALVVSPYVQSLRINANRSSELLEALIPYAHNYKDPKTKTSITWLDVPSKVGLCREMPLESVAACIAKQRPEKQQPDDTFVILLRGTASPPLLRSSLRFSTFLTELVSQERPDVLELPSCWRNEEGDEELENRFTDTDIKLAVLWLNDYAYDAVHKMVTEDPTAYFVSLQGRSFFTEHIHKAERPAATLRRCLSVLSLAHYLRIATLENLMLSILASRQGRELFDSLAKSDALRR